MAEVPPTLRLLLDESVRRLAEAGIEDARLDARLLVEHFSATSRSDAIARPDLAVGPAEAAAIRDAVRRRLQGEPVHRILGFREFYGLRLLLSADTLEPRPDTETLVDALLDPVREIAARGRGCRILDLGTGTGAIALALLSQVPAATAVGTDISAGALATAAKNAERLGLGGRFTTIHSDWFEKISGRFHAIASNPPYIPVYELATLQREVQLHDPARALDGGADGLDAYRAIAAGARNHLEDGGVLGLESGHTQRHELEKLFTDSGYRMIEARCDLAGNHRVLVFRLGT